MSGASEWKVKQKSSDAVMGVCRDFDGGAGMDHWQIHHDLEER
jgi:hypothetical protein